jgi:uncharacterized protein (DUF2384 family)
MIAMPTTRVQRLRAVDASDTAREGAVLSKAAVRAAAFLELPNAALAHILGLSEATISRLKAGEYVISPDKKAFELAQLFVRLFRSLDAIMGSDDAASRSWIRTNNVVLGGKPIDLIQSVKGLTTVLQYVDSRRAPI